ncbi:ethylene-responsive transcription factor ERF016 [Vigna angularis]|nr:ethylene-responsive transcription factor ERF016 [Vigna angularis]
MDTDMEKQAMSGGGDCKSGEKLYKGVRKRKWGKWVSEIRLPNSRERIWLGSYDSPEKAARAFDAALFCLRGRRANFNFPNTPCNMDTNVPLPLPALQSLTPHEIQEVAAKFANEDPLLLKPLAQESHADADAHAAAAAGNSSSFRGNLCKSDSTVESSSSTRTPTATTSSCSTTMHECDGLVQVDHGDMDWTFLKEFDYSNEVFPVGSDYDLYFELHKMHSTSGELLYSTPPPPPFEGYQELTEAEEDPFSHQSFLWNWNF